MRFHNDLFLLWDCCAGLAAGYWANFSCVRTAVCEGRSEGPRILYEMALISVVAALLLREPALASDRRYLTLPALFGMLLRRGTMTVGVLVLVSCATLALPNIGQLWAAGWISAYLPYVVFSRVLFVIWGRHLQSQRALRESVAIIGGPKNAQAVAVQLNNEADVVFVSEYDDLDGPEVSRLLDLARNGVVETIILVSPSDNDRVAPLLDGLQSIPVEVAITTELPEQATPASDLRCLAGVPLAVLANGSVNSWQLMAKACFDRLVAAVLLVLVSPLLCAISILVSLDSPGPVLFRQTRTGWGGQRFTVLKFRTMRHDARPGTAARQTARDDARLTRFGRRLRRASFDELPQLWNVLMGDMSLVGPRPHADGLHVQERAGLAVVAEYAKRQRVKPGLTGWAQVHGYRGAATDVEHLRRRIELDLFYIDNWSLWLDLRILLMTPWELLTGRNAF